MAFRSSIAYGVRAELQMEKTGQIKGRFKERNSCTATKFIPKRIQNFRRDPKVST